MLSANLVRHALILTALVSNSLYLAHMVAIAQWCLTFMLRAVQPLGLPWICFVASPAQCLHFVLKLVRLCLADLRSNSTGPICLRLCHY